MLNSEMALATALHRNFCTLNHHFEKDEKCKWYYECSWRADVMWEQPAHKEWLEKAQHIARGSNYSIEQILNAIEVIREIKPLLET